MFNAKVLLIMLPCFSFVNIPCNFLFQISGRLFSDSGPRRSLRLSGDASVNANPNTATVSGNGTSYTSKHLGGSKLSSMAFRSVTVRKGQSWANENIGEGDESLYAALFYYCIMSLRNVILYKHYCFEEFYPS